MPIKNKLNSVWLGFIGNIIHDQSLIPLEETARQSKVGLWADANPMAPWDYRHGCKGKDTKQSSNSPVEPVTPIN